MKKANVLGLLSLLMVLMMGLTFTSCDKDDDDDNTSASIVGQWKVVSVDDDGLDEKDKSDIASSISRGWNFVFNADNSGSEYFDGETDIFTYKVDGNKLSITYEYDPEDPEEYTIQKLTGSELVIEDSGYKMVLNKK